MVVEDCRKRGSVSRHELDNGEFAIVAYQVRKGDDVHPGFTGSRWPGRILRPSRIGRGTMPDEWDYADHAVVSIPRIDTALRAHSGREGQKYGEETSGHSLPPELHPSMATAEVIVISITFVKEVFIRAPHNGVKMFFSAALNSDNDKAPVVLAKCIGRRQKGQCRAALKSWTGPHVFSTLSSNLIQWS